MPGVGLGPNRTGGHSSLRQGHQRGERAADEEAAPEDLAHVADLLEVAPDVARADGLVVRRQGTGPARGLAALQRTIGRLGREPPGLDRIVDALQRRHVHEPRPLAREQQARCVQPLRQRQEPAALDRLRAPLHPLAALEQPADLRMGLQLLEEIVDGEGRVAVIEPDHHPERDQLVPHRVDERAAELPVAAHRPERPAHRVHDPVERLGHAPDLFDRELPRLWVLAREAEPVERRAGQVPLRSLGEHGHARDEVGAGLEVRQLLAATTPALVPGPNALDASVRDEQLRGARLRQDHRACLLRLVGEEAPELRERGEVVALVAHRGGRGDRDGWAYGLGVGKVSAERGARVEVSFAL